MTTPDILALMKELKKLVIAVEKISEVLCKPVITANNVERVCSQCGKSPGGQQFFNGKCLSCLGLLKGLPHA